jgi:hypothetical protein
MTSKPLLFIFFLFILSCNFLQAQNDIPQVTLSDIPGGVILRSEQFDGNSLWGYIDGGADIYLEYGFEKVSVEEIEWHKRHLKIEIYKMTNENSAFGIYSVSQNKCSTSASFSKFNCITPHQIQAVSGKLYIRIANDDGSDEAQNISLQLIRRFTKDTEYSYPTFFNDKLYLQHLRGLKYIKGPLGIQNGFPAWEDMFDGMKNYSLFLLPVDLNGGSVCAAQIQFSTSAEKNLFYEKLKIPSTKKTKYRQTITGGRCRAVREISPLKIYFIESDLKAYDLDPYLKTIKNIK